MTAHPGSESFPSLLFPWLRRPSSSPGGQLSWPQGHTPSGTTPGHLGCSLASCFPFPEIYLSHTHTEECAMMPPSNNNVPVTDVKTLLDAAVLQILLMPASNHSWPFNNRAHLGSIYFEPRIFNALPFIFMLPLSGYEEMETCEVKLLPKVTWSVDLIFEPRCLIQKTVDLGILWQSTG